MAKIVMTAQVEDLSKWEERFRTHGDVFRSQTIISPYSIATSEDGNQVALYAEVTDVDTFLSGLESPATAEAMAFDGVKRETVKLFVLDKEFHF